MGNSNDDEDVVLSDNEEAAVDKSNELEIQLLKTKYPLLLINSLS